MRVLQGSHRAQENILLLDDDSYFSYCHQNLVTLKKKAVKLCGVVCDPLTGWFIVETVHQSLN